MAGVQVNVRLDPALAARLRRHAAANGQPIGQVIAAALADHLPPDPPEPTRLVDLPDLNPQPVGNVWGGRP